VSTPLQVRTGQARLAKGLQLVGAVWVFGWIGIFALGLLTRGWLDLHGSTEGKLIDLSAATRLEYNLVRFSVLLPGFAAAALGYGLRRRARTGTEPSS
jgi:hypothetical protein